jgi:endonuclease/exonuclease/phosphatase family metal-dependent hydrolase
MNIFWGDFNAKVDREDIFKMTAGNENSQEISTDDELRVANFATSKNLVVKSNMIPHRGSCKYTLTSSGVKTHNQIDHVLIDKRQRSSILNVPSFTGADCDTDRYLVAAKVRERLAVSKRAAQKMDVERFNLKNLNEVGS